MQKFEPRTFNIPTLKGISAKNIEEHMKLYQGYVKHANLIQSMIEMYGKVQDEGGQYSVAEISRRFSFEWNGMRNHEYYFSALEGGPAAITADGPLYTEIGKMFGSFEEFMTRFKTIAVTRGVGWAILYWDSHTKQLVTGWTDEQHLGQLISCQPLLMLDMWEHSYVYDYQPSGKKQYVEDFFSNLNWGVIESNFEAATK
jgi:superoxide dismutase, Fe-Mn family